MRFMFCLLLSVFLFIGGAYAQGDTVYNSKKYGNDKGSRTIYNSGKSSTGTGGPILLKNIIRGSNIRTGKSNKSYSPYDLRGSRDNGYALSMTPDQVRAKQAKNRERAKKRAQEAELRRKAKIEARKSGSDYDQLKKETNAYTSRFQDGDSAKSEEKPPVFLKSKRKSVYVRDKDGLTTPEKVFGSIY